MSSSSHWPSRTRIAGLLTVLFLVAISFPWFTEVSHRRFASLFRPDLAAQGESAIWVDIVALITFPALLVILPAIMRPLFRPEINPRPNPERSCRALIVFLSPSKRNEGEPDLDEALIKASLDSPQGYLQFGQSPWRMPSQAITEQLAHKRLERVLVIASADPPDGPTGSFREYARFRSLLVRLLPKDSLVVVQAPVDLGITGFDSGVDFANAGKLCELLEKCYHGFEEAGFRNADVLLDLTSGTAGASIVAAMTAFHGSRRWQYVSASSPTQISDISCTLAGSHLIGGFLERVPAELLPDVERYFMGRAGLRFSLAALLSMFHWVSLEILHLTEGHLTVWSSAPLFVALVLLVLTFRLFVKESRRSRLRIKPASGGGALTLVVILSPAQKPSGSVPRIGPTVLRTSDFRHLGLHSWRMPLEAIRLQLAHGRLRNVLVLCSPQSETAFETFRGVVSEAFSGYPHLSLARITSLPDFFSVESVLDALNEEARKLPKGHSVAADVTGGTKIASVALAAVALRNGWLLQTLSPTATKLMEERIFVLDYATSVET